jgi:hypothetical protein
MLLSSGTPTILWWASRAERRRTILRGISGAPGEVWSGVERGEDATDRVRAVRLQNRKRRGEGKPETFTFLGFTHYCGKRRKDGAFILWRETAKKRLVAKLKAIKLELKHRRHEPIASVGAWLQKVTSGYY